MTRDLLRIIDDLIPRPDGSPPPTIETVHVVEGPDVDGFYTVTWAGTEFDRVPSIAPLSTVDVPARALATAGGLLILGSPGVGGGGASTYTPALLGATTNPFIGDGVAAGFWSAQGRYVDVDFEITLGTGFTPGSGAYSVTLPAVPDVPDATPVGLVHLNHPSTGGRRVWALISVTGTDQAWIRSTGDTQSVGATPTVPFTWEVGDSLKGTARFRVGVLVPQQAPTLANVINAADSGLLNTRDVNLVAGTADKIIVLCRMEGTSTSRTIVVPDGWTVAGPTTLTGAGLTLLYRANTDDTAVTIDITSAETAALGWVTAHVIDGNLDQIVTSNNQINGAAATIDPGAVSGALTSWLGFAVASQWGTIIDVPPTVWPVNLPNDQVYRFRNDGVNDARFGFASGPFLATSSINPDSFTFDSSEANTRWLTAAIPRAL